MRSQKQLTTTIFPFEEDPPVKDWAIYRHGDDVSVVFSNPKPWWKVWEPGEFVRTFERKDFILFYQSLARAARPALIREEEGASEREEFIDDVRRVMAQSVQENPSRLGPSLADAARMADLLAGKGYRKT